MHTMLNSVELDRYLREQEQRGRFSGVALITQAGATLFAGAYGFAHRGWKIRNTLNVRFDTASITKLFTAIATLQLIERGHFALDTTAVGYLDLHGTAISPDATVFHLLTHTSGIADDADEEAGERYEDLWVDKPNYAIAETADFLPQFAYKPANFAPGAGCRYNNCAYVLLGLMIEKASGLPYRDYVRRHVFARAGMADSGFLRMDEANPLVAEGYAPIFDAEVERKVVGWKKNIYSYPPIGSPDGGAYVTAGDLDRFLRSVKAGRLLSSELTKTFFTPQVHCQPMQDGWTKAYGYGLWFYVEQSGNVLFAEKEGVNVGVSAVLRHFPEQDINIILLSNLEEGVWEPVWAIQRMVFGEE